LSHWLVHRLVRVCSIGFMAWVSVLIVNTLYCYAQTIVNPLDEINAHTI